MVESDVPKLCRRFVIVPWEFFKFNVLSAGSAQYGSHSWHWNFSQGFPTVAATLLPLGLAGVAASRRSEGPLRRVTGEHILKLVQNHSKGVQCLAVMCHADRDTCRSFDPRS